MTPIQATAATAQANPVLGRARAALHAGRLEAPEGRNALDLFQAVLLAQPEHAEAQVSLARTIDLLLQRAQQELDAGHKPEAERLVQRVLAVVPEDPQAQVLARRISPPDTPSRQLSREQHAEVEARLAGTEIVSAPARARTLEEIQAELASLPGPVTKLTGPSSDSTATAPTTAGAGRTARSASRHASSIRRRRLPRSAQLRARAGQRTAGRRSDRPDGAARARRSCARVSESQRRPQDVRSTCCAGFATSA
ncbi:MAG: hypothetical protein IPF50_14170 [Proteobacteria bacterium]|nr:hypothetical protein [Pseudomonadota bacterium]